MPADSYECPADRDTGDDLACDCPRSHPHCGLTRARAPTASVVANPVLLQVGEIRVSGAELVLDIRVVAAPLIDVVDDQADGSSRRHCPAVVVVEDP